MEKDQAEFDAVQSELKELGLPSSADEETETPAEQAPDAPEVVPDTPEPQAEEPEEPEPKQVSPREFKEYKKELRAELEADFNKKLEQIKAEYSKERPQETKTEDLETDIKALAEELQFDEAKVKRIIEVARKGLESSPDDKAFLDSAKKELEELRAEKAARQAEAEFNGKWGHVLTNLKAEFPNASEEQIAAAKEKMAELAEDDQFHGDLDYALLKNKETFSKLLFSPKQKTFESPRPHAESEATDEWPDIKPDMSPRQIEEIEKRRQAILDRMPGDKMHIRHYDPQRGELMDIYE